MTISQHLPIVVLSRALDQTGDVLADIHPDQLSAPTPCRDWDVARLAAHLVGDARRFLQAARGEKPDWGNDPSVAGNGATEFRTAADDLIHSWHERGDTDLGQADWQTAEFAVHTWDLVRATGQTRALDPEVAQRGLDYMAAGLTPDNRPPAFGPEVPVAADAPVYDRLAAYAGRDPHA
ncbi:MAG TPA: TIGR03086 family metal-binding protein [Nocardioides sp.]|jgi:uncharacterized protein (TIGR03086 family)